jgi:hypothetical protein
MRATKLGAGRWALYVIWPLVASGCPEGGLTDSPASELPDAGPKAPAPDAAAAAPDRLRDGAPDLVTTTDQALPDVSLGQDLGAGSTDMIARSETPLVDRPRLAFDCRPLSMVWKIDGIETRREGYTFVADSCAGYRCVVGNDISPACYNERECPTVCSGLCLSVPSMRTQCPIKFDAGEAIDRPTSIAVDADEPLACDGVDMVWEANDVELRRDRNCASQVASSSGFCYSFAEDTCDGYRCLVGNDLSPSCYSPSACPGKCSGRCVLIATMRGRCAGLDGGN